MGSSLPKMKLYSLTESVLFPFHAEPAQPQMAEPLGNIRSDAMDKSAISEGGDIEPGDRCRARVCLVQHRSADSARHEWKGCLDATPWPGVFAL